MSIGVRIKQVRKEIGESQTTFAQRFVVSLSALKAYELDNREPPASFVIELYRQLAIEPTWLLSGRGARSSALRLSNIENAVVAVRTFATIQNVNLAAEKEAKLVLLLAEYFDEGGEDEGPLVKKILENAI